MAIYGGGWRWLNHRLIGIQGGVGSHLSRLREVIIEYIWGDTADKLRKKDQAEVKRIFRACDGHIEIGLSTTVRFTKGRMIK